MPPGPRPTKRAPTFVPQVSKLEGMSSVTDKPMARANAHLASARYAEAAGAFRAVLHIDPQAFQAHFGLADALVGRGQPVEAVAGLITAAESCNANDDHAAALTLYGKALAIDPSRLELHLDVAMAEAALGREDSAQARLENLAEIYMQAGRTDEAAEMYRFLASWDEADEQDDDDDDAGEETAYSVEPGPQPEPEPEPRPAPEPQPAPTAAADPTPQHFPPSPPPMGAGVPHQVVSTETVMVPTILITPDGQLLDLSDPSRTVASSVAPADVTLSPALIEVAQSKPIDLVDEASMAAVEGTVVAFPPPPPELPPGTENTGSHNREDLEAAVAAAMDNLSQIEEIQEEDKTLMMQRPILPRRKTVTTPAAPKRPATPPAPAAATPPAPAATPPAARTSDGKLRLRPAPRPRAAEAPKPPSEQPTLIAKRMKPRPAPPQGARPVATPRREPVAPAKAPARKAARPVPSQNRKPLRPRPRPSAAKPRPAPPTGAATPAAKPVRPHNPLVDRLRRRAGLGKEGRPAAQPRTTRSRPTEPISVRKGRPGEDED